MEIKYLLIPLGNSFHLVESVSPCYMIYDFQLRHTCYLLERNLQLPFALLRRHCFESRQENAFIIIPLYEGMASIAVGLNGGQNY